MIGAESLANGMVAVTYRDGSQLVLSEQDWLRLVRQTTRIVKADHGKED